MRMVTSFARNVTLNAMRLAIGFAFAVFALLANAQVFPAKPLRMLVGFSPGGPNDIIARIVSQKLAENLGQPVVVENRAGASGLIATELLTKAPADGYMLMLGSTGTHAISPHLTARLGYDPVNALAAVAQVGTTVSALVVHPQVAASSVGELIALAKSRPGKLTYASSGNGTTLHLGGMLFALMTGVDLVHVPYKGNAPALNDLVAGQVDMIFSPLPPALPLAKAGKLRILGVGARERHPLAPEVPTIAEQGVPGYEMGTWYGIFAPAGSPADAIERLASEIAKVVADPRARELMLTQGVDPHASSPAEFRRFFLAEFARWGKLVRDAGIKAD
jgi:tripartite-type tricarboxylate transporter receptor subunit TctC